MATTEFDERAARDEIHAALLSYTRGIDRLDVDAVLAAFHPGATVDYGGGMRAVEDFASYAIGALRTKYEATQHRISNTTIEFGGDAARVETYVLAFHAEVAGDDRFLHTFNGRYIDTFARREGSWRIAQRILRSDWTSREPVSAEMAGSFVVGARDRTDPIYDALP